MVDRGATDTNFAQLVDDVWARRTPRLLTKLAAACDVLSRAVSRVGLTSGAAERAHKHLRVGQVSQNTPEVTHWCYSGFPKWHHGVDSSELLTRITGAQVL